MHKFTDQFLAAVDQPRTRTALLGWIAIWPSITLLLALLQPLMADLPLAARTLILTAILVPWMNFVVMPRLTRRFSGWLNR